MFHSIVSIKKRPYALARMKGSDDHARINGVVYFYQVPAGVLVLAELKGLPLSDDPCKKPIFALHIHSGASCTGNNTDPFADALTHYNPKDCPHPYHAGDLPPIFGARGFGFSASLTDLFSAEEILGKTIILHSSPDDFTTQPSGNAGSKIACGVIFPTSRLRAGEKK